MHARRWRRRVMAGWAGGGGGRAGGRQPSRDAERARRRGCLGRAGRAGAPRCRHGGARAAGRGVAPGAAGRGARPAAPGGRLRVGPLRAAIRRLGGLSPPGPPAARPERPAAPATVTRRAVQARRRQASHRQHLHHRSDGAAGPGLIVSSYRNEPARDRLGPVRVDSAPNRPGQRHNVDIYAGFKILLFFDVEFENRDETATPFGLNCV
jgi:hypothetical protein